jgi:hypothetical protein
MRLLFFHAFLGWFAFCLHAAEPESDYPSDLSKWKEVVEPPVAKKLEHAMWTFASNYCPYEWRVFMADGKPCAQLDNELPEMAKDNPPPKPTFKPRAEKLVEAQAFASVDEGWLVGFNEGEFGAALYWFSRDGKRSYKISDHQVVDFFTRPDGVYAIEGLAHMSMSEGSVIRVTFSKDERVWKANSVLTLPFAPCAVSQRPDGAMLITLTDSIVSVDAKLKITTLLTNPSWGALYANSSVLSKDGKRLYIGMRQFTGEFDLTTTKSRFLIPSDKYLHKLSREDEEDIRQRYGK